MTHRMILNLCILVMLRLTEVQEFLLKVGSHAVVLYIC